MSEPWMRWAACHGTDPDLFFPDRWSDHEEELAKSVCRACPVCRPCLEYALREPCFQSSGVLGGTTPNERSRIKRARRKAAA